jgi:hypothetical protein
MSDEFKVVFGTSSTMPSGYTQSSLEAQLGNFQLPSGAVVITAERLGVEFGQPLRYLWSTYRTMAAAVPYQTYTSDVAQQYEKDVFEVDPGTGTFFNVVNGALQYNILHRQGDPVLDQAGQPTYKHRRGDPIIDEVTGLPKPIPGYSTELDRMLEVFVMDAIYAFANDTNAQRYLKDVVASLTTWMNTDLVKVNQTGLEQTRTYYHPKVARGIIPVRINEDLLFSVDAEQTLAVTLYVPKDVYTNSALLASLYDSTISTIEEYLLNNTTISTTSMQKEMMAVYGADVVGITIENLLGRKDNVVATLVDSANQFSLAKSLRVQANGQLVIAEDITISFAIHKTETQMQ